MFKKFVQQGRRAFGARSVQVVREHDKSPRTQMAGFFNIGLIYDNSNSMIKRIGNIHVPLGTNRHSKWIV